MRGRATDEGRPCRSAWKRRLARFGLAEAASKPGRELSGGNRRKVELLRALLHEPRLLLMDEATVGLDPASRAQLLDEVLRARAERGLGVLWATHLVDEAERAQRVIVLHKGKVRWDGSVEGLREAQGRDTLQQAFLQLTGGEKNADKIPA